MNLRPETACSCFSRVSTPAIVLFSELKTGNVSTPVTVRR